MYPQISLLEPCCTHCLDSLIAEHGARYATERTDFDRFFPRTTVAQIQRLLREPLAAESRHERATVVTRLLWAQQESPHPLWTLLLVQAFEATLVRRRRTLSTEPNAILDGFVLQTFVGALDYIPQSVLALDLVAQESP